MKNESTVMLVDPVIERVHETPKARPPAAPPEATMLSRVYLWLRWGGDKYWGTVASINRTRCTVFSHARFKNNSKIMVRFHFQGKSLISEDVEAKVIWQNGDSVAVEFEKPLAAGSPELEKVPCLQAHLAKTGKRRS